MILNTIKKYLSKSYTNFPYVFVPCIGLVSLIQRSIGFIDANGCFGDLFWTVTGRDVLNQDKWFIQDRVK